MEKKIRDLSEANKALREDVEDAQAQLTDRERQSQHLINDIEAKRKTLQDTVDHLKKDMQQMTIDLDSKQAQLVERDNEVATLEASVAQIKSRASDDESLAVIRRELSEQVGHIRELESTKREQLGELKRLRSAHQSVQVVEEQKRSLETQLQVLQDTHRQLGEAKIQKEVLEDEKRSWSALLEREGHEREFNSPESVVEALVQERIERASLVDRVGKLEADLAGKDETISALDAANVALKRAEKEYKANTSHGASEASQSKAFRLMERQRNLAVKEVEYLRAQLKTFDTEETVLMSNDNFDTQRAEQVKHLESLVDQYRREIQSLHDELTHKEPGLAVSESAEQRGTKRPISVTETENEDSQVGPLLRKTKNLQKALSEAAAKTKLVETELRATKSQVASLTSRSRTRILELRSNPTANHEAVKLSTLETLRSENAALLSQIRGDDLSNVPVVPAATVDNLTLQLSKLQAEVASGQKQTRRLREIFGSKATEFREAVASILGYKINFLPNGKAKITSTYHVNKGNLYSNQDASDTANTEAAVAAAQEQEDYENNRSIIFDGEEGTMKFSGGAHGEFAYEMKELVNFWVAERRSVPCFLAAMTLELFEKDGRTVDEYGEGTGRG